MSEHVKSHLLTRTWLTTIVYLQLELKHKVKIVLKPCNENGNDSSLKYIQLDSLPLL